MSWRLVLERLLPKPKALILLYHRVTQLPTDPYGLCTSPQLFEQHVKLITTRANPLTVSELVCGLRRGSLPPRPVALTFDDGYADNLTEAAPLLTRFHCPATFFVTGLPAEQGEFWWDQLDSLLLQTGCRSNWPSPERAENSLLDAERHRHWRRWQRPPTPACLVFRKLHARLEKMTEGQQKALLQELQQSFQPEPRSTHQRLSIGQLRQLADHCDFEIGCHTLTHPRLTLLPRHQQLSEIRLARDWLQNALDRTVSGFAFPFGAWDDWSLECVKNSNFRYACLAQPGVVWSHSDPFRLTRCQADGIEIPNLEKLLRHIS